MFQTDCSHSESQMTQTLEDCINMDTSKLEFRMFKAAPHGESYMNETESWKELKGMTLEHVRMGLLLRPMEGDYRTGTQYFMDGLWMPHLDAWVFKMHDYDRLVEAGAEYISEMCLVDNYDSGSDDEMPVLDDSTDEDETTDEDMPDLIPYKEEVFSDDESNYSDDASEAVSHDADAWIYLTGLEIETYGKGYLVRAPQEHRDYGTKYYGSGWWIEAQAGWFFKKEHYDELIGYGAVESSPEPTLEWVVKYGHGYMLMPLESHPHFGENYYRNGWWNKQQQGWFFKKEFVDTETMSVM